MNGCVPCRNVLAAIVSVAGVGWASSVSLAGVPVLVTSDLTIGPTDTTINGVPLIDADVTVQGAVLTMNGRHTIASLRLEYASTGSTRVTHSPMFQHTYGPGDIARGLHLTVLGDVNVPLAGQITARGCGFRVGGGPGSGGCGGASHGGRGSRGPYPCTDSGISPVYGERWRPEDFGSGGGGAALQDNYGGGCLRLWVGGTFTIRGSVIAAGGPLDEVSSSSDGPGGPSGGSLWIRAGTLDAVDTAVVGAWGFAGFGHSGGGGGGRVALFYANGPSPLVHVEGAPAGFVENGIRPVGEGGTVVVGSGLIDIATQPPRYTQVRQGDSVRLSVTATTRAVPNTLAYQWRRRGDRGAYSPLTDGDMGGRLSGATTPELTITMTDCSDSGYYDCMIQDATGWFPSESSLLAVWSRADLDDGTSIGTSDGGLGVEDLLYYLSLYDAGAVGADFDDGTGSGVPDGGVGIEDLLYYLLRYDHGC